MVSLLSNQGQTDVSALLKALQTSLRFEQEMRNRFREQDPSTTSAGGGLGGADSTNDTDGDSTEKDNLTPEIESLGEHGTSANGPKETSRQRKIGTAVSAVFDSFLGPYVSLERGNLEEMLQRLSSEEDTTTSSGEGGNAKMNIYGSSASMFVFIKNSIKRCTALCTGTAFLALTKEFKHCMQQYGESLRLRLPIPSGIQSPVYKLATGAEYSVGYVINTCEYCAENIPKLEDAIQQKIRADLVTQVDMSAEADLFLDMCALGIKVLVSGTLEKLEPAFKSMQGLQWGTVAQVGEESPYVHKWMVSTNSVLAQYKLSTNSLLTQCKLSTNLVLAQY